MKLTKTTWWIIGGVGVASLGVGGYWLWKQRKQKKQQQPSIAIPTGKAIKVTQGGKATTLITPDWKNPFDSGYIKDVKTFLGGKSIQELDPSAAKQFAQQLKNAKGRFNDDEEAIGMVFQKKLKDKTQVAAVSKAFYGNYKTDLWQFLRSFLSDSELNALVHQPIKRLPNYRLIG